MSHSFDYAAVMLSKSKPVGIDIELVSNKVERIAHKFLNATELAFIEPKNKIEQLYVCWCAKEAVYKCNGRKVISFLDHIRVKSINWEKKTPVQVNIEKAGIQLEFDVNYMPFGDYMIGYVKGR
jgi:4'-phosphopantetheinyl transferase